MLLYSHDISGSSCSSGNCRLTAVSLLFVGHFTLITRFRGSIFDKTDSRACTCLETASCLFGSAYDPKSAKLQKDDMQSCNNTQAVLLPPPRRLCFLRCLFVCLSVSNFAQTSRQICMKFPGKVGNGPMNKWLHFGGDLEPIRQTAGLISRHW